MNDENIKDEKLVEYVANRHQRFIREIESIFFTESKIIELLFKIPENSPKFLKDEFTNTFCNVIKDHLHAIIDGFEFEAKKENIH